MKQHEYFYFLALFTIGVAIIGSFFILPKWVIATVIVLFVVVGGIFVAASIEAAREERRKS